MKPSRLLLAAVTLAAALTPALGLASPDESVGTATLYSAGAEITTHFSRDYTISPLNVLVASEPAYPKVGDRVTVTVSVSNSGSVAVEKLIPELVIVSGSTYVSAPAGPQPSGPVRLAPAGRQAFKWTLSVTGRGKVRISVAASGTVSGQNVTVTDSASHDLTAPTVAQLSSSLSPNPAQVTRGKWFTLTVTVSNTGGVAATGILPSLQPTDNAKLVTLAAGPEPAKPIELRAGASRDFKFTFSANGSGTVSFSTTVSGKADLRPPGMVSRASSGLVARTRALWRRSLAASREFARKAKLKLMPPPPPPPEERLFVSFETEKETGWDTGGYVELSLSDKHVTEGKSSCRAVFLLPSSLTLSPTGSPEGFRPGFSRNSPARGPFPALDPDDWSGFLALRADCYNDSAVDLELRLALVDIKGHRYETLRKLAAGGATTFEVSFEEPKEASLDLARVSELRLSVDTSSAKEKPAVYFDNLRFALPIPPVTTTFSVSSTAFQTVTPSGSAP